MKCYQCNKELEYYESVDLSGRSFCPECHKKHLQKNKYLFDKYTEIRQEIMFERAVSFFGKFVDLYKYKTNLENVYKVMKQEKCFDSRPEIVAAFVLEIYNVEYVAQYPVDEYRVDFWLPDLNCCLEIDGERHKNKAKEDFKRDLIIREKIGRDKEVIHISVNNLEKNPLKLVEAIKTDYNEIKKLRAANNGLIPESYSRGAKEYYASLMLPKKRGKGLPFDFMDFPAAKSS